MHRDLKPDNVIITRVSEKLHAKVLDFGIARLENSASLTGTGTVMGTPRYMSPEQCRGEVCTPLSDQYAFGLVLYEMLVGAPAMVSETALGYIYLHQNQTPPAPSEVRGDSALELLDPVVARALAKDPAERFACMAEIGEALLTVVGQARTAGLGAERTIQPGAGSSGQHFAVTSELLSDSPTTWPGSRPNSGRRRPVPPVRGWPACSSSVRSPWWRTPPGGPWRRSASA